VHLDSPERGSYQSLDFARWNASANLRESTPIPSGIVELVQQTYREDFRVFGYSPKPPMTVC